MKPLEPLKGIDFAVIFFFTKFMEGIILIFLSRRRVQQFNFGSGKKSMLKSNYLPINVRTQFLRSKNPQFSIMRL